MYVLRVQNFRNERQSTPAQLSCAIFDSLEGAKDAASALESKEFDVAGLGDGWFEEADSDADVRSDEEFCDIQEDASAPVKARAECRIYEVEQGIVSRPFRPSAVSSCPIPTTSAAHLDPLQPLRPGTHCWVLSLNGAPRSCYADLCDAEIALAAAQLYPEEFCGGITPVNPTLLSITRLPVGGMPADFSPEWRPETREASDDMHLPPTLAAVLEARHKLRVLAEDQIASLDEVMTLDRNVTAARMRAVSFLTGKDSNTLTPRAVAAAARAHSETLRRMADDPTEDLEIRELARKWVQKNGEARECAVIKIGARKIEWTGEDVAV